MYTYDVSTFTTCLESVIRENISPEAWHWLSEEATALKQEQNIRRFNLVFASLPRKVGKGAIGLDESSQIQLKQIRQGLTVHHWTTDRLCRVWLLLHMDPSDKSYVRTVEGLFMAAEMNEQVALYSALPLLAFPEAWRSRCAEGIRSNMGVVLEAIMCDNPYPSEQLDELAWNQLVLKAIFTEKPVQRIQGLSERANQNLADTLSDYALERWAAHRPVNPLLWMCIGRFINTKIFPQIERLANSENALEREAAMLACLESSYPPAKELLEKNNELRSIRRQGNVTWNTIAEKAEANKVTTE